MNDLTENTDIMLPVLSSAFLTFMLCAMFALILVRVMQPRLQLNRRLRNLGLSPSKSDTPSAQSLNPRQRRIQQRLHDLEKKQKKKGSRERLRGNMLKAGLEPNTRVYFFGSGGLGLVALSAAYLFGMPWHLSIVSGLVASYLLPKWVLSMLFNRRQKNFTSHFSSALDVIIRGVRSGLPVIECLRIVSREIPNPVGDEFSQLVEGQKIGLTISELLHRGLERMPTKEYKFFAVVIQIQQETGGNLADILENLSNVLRDRKAMRDKALALSSEATASAAIIGSLPILVCGALALVSWEYMSVLFSTDTGNFFIGGGLAWMAVGVTVMYNMINFKT